MKKIGIFLMVLVLALGATGVGYAIATGGWSQTLYINGGVSTGNVQAEFTHADQQGDYNEVATCDVAIETGASENDTLTCSITNAYPGAQVTFYFTVANVGSIPISVELVPGASNPSVLGLETNFSGGQIGVGGSQEGSITVTVLDVAEDMTGENAYNFSYTIDVNQFNNSTPT